MLAVSRNTTLSPSETTRSPPPCVSTMPAGSASTGTTRTSVALPFSRFSTATPFSERGPELLSDT